jgi:hypothetical protein
MYKYIALLFLILSLPSYAQTLSHYKAAQNILYNCGGSPWSSPANAIAAYCGTNNGYYVLTETDSIVADGCGYYYVLPQEEVWCTTEQCPAGTTYNSSTGNCDSPEPETWCEVHQISGETYNAQTLCLGYDNPELEECTHRNAAHQQCTLPEFTPTHCNEELGYYPAFNSCVQSLGEIDESNPDQPEQCLSFADATLNANCQAQIDECTSDGWTAGFVNGAFYCLNDSEMDTLNPDGAPSCTNGSFLVDDGAGNLTCANQADGTQTPPSNVNVDTSGLEGLISQTNQKLDGISGQLTSANSKLSGIKTGIDDINAYYDGRSASSGTCASAPVCSGDSIDCAILAEQWKMRCEGEGTASTIEGEMNNDIGNAGGILTGYNVDGDGELTDLDEGDVNVESVIGDITNATSGLTASCPSPRDVNLSFYDGSFQWDEFCATAEDMNPLIRLVFSVFAALLFIRGIMNQ